MSHQTPPLTTDKTIAQLQDEFRTLNEQAMEIQGRMDALAQQLADSGFKPSGTDDQDPAGKDTVRL